MHLQYQSKLQARKALSKDGKVFGDTIMVGVKPCIDKVGAFWYYTMCLFYYDSPLLWLDIFFSLGMSECDGQQCHGVLPPL